MQEKEVTPVDSEGEGKQVEDKENSTNRSPEDIETVEEDTANPSGLLIKSQESISPVGVADTTVEDIEGIETRLRELKGRIRYE